MHSLHRQAQAPSGLRNAAQIVKVSSVVTQSIHGRRVHSTPKGQGAVLPMSPPRINLSSPSSTTNSTATSPLSGLPLSQILRTYLITSISSSPFLLDTSSALLRRMLNSKSILFDVQRNPIIGAVLRTTFYKQFCLGVDAFQVANSCKNLRAQGFAGVILDSALEVLKDAKSDEARDIMRWQQNLLDTVGMVAEGDFVGLKWSGMGPAAMRLMAKNEAPTDAMKEAMHTVCSEAARKGVSLLPAAEETWTLDGFHSWTMAMQRAYNVNGKSVVYNTYQAYLKQTPAILSEHIADAKQMNYVLGAKLVRGAYLTSDDRSLIHPNIEATHHAYNTIAASLIQRQYNDVVRSVQDAESSWPDVNVVIATHNAESVRKARTLRTDQVERGETLTPLAFAQLQGMADEVSCTLIATGQEAADGEKGEFSPEQVFKCGVWGNMHDCLNYLLRRAAENKDAAGRTSTTRMAMAAEIRRRFGAAFGLS